MLLDEIRGIKTELREIKQQIGLGDGHRDSHQRTDDE